MASMKALAAIALTMVIVCPIALGYLLAIDEEEAVGWETTDQYNISNLLLNHQTPYFMTFASPSNNSYLTSGNSPVYQQIGSTVTSIPVLESASDLLYVGTSYVTVPYSSCWFFMEKYCALKIVLKDGTTHTEISQIYQPRVDVYPTGIVNIAAPFNVQYQNVDHVELQANTATNFTVHYTRPSGSYADPSAGWTVPGATYWYNGHVNNSVTFTMSVPPGGMGQLGVVDPWPFPTEPGNNYKLFVKNTDGTIEVGHNLNDWVTLGKYSAVQVRVTEEDYEVSGLNAWGALGGNQQTYNTVHVSHPSWENMHVYVNSGAIYRVDSAEISAGSYPSTLDYTLDLNALFPGDLMAASLNSIGVYGDSLSLGSTAYPVTNGKITVDGKQVALKGALISFIPDETGQLIGSIGGREVGSFATVPPITFGGEWSLTAIAYKVEETPTTNMSWHAGEFGLDKAGFVAAGLIFAGIAFVILGMNGRASGSKVGLLMLICGGAAAAYIIIL